MDQRKVAVFESGDWLLLSWEDTYCVDDVGATFALRDPWAGFCNLVDQIEQPAMLEWHLTHPEGDVLEGVYVSRLRSIDDLHQFLQTYADFFAQDGRAILAVSGANARVTLDEHNWVKWEGDRRISHAYAERQGLRESPAELRFPHKHVFNDNLAVRICEIYADRPWQCIRAKST